MKIGIVGSGRIAKRFVADAKMVQDIQIFCVYNPKEASAKHFAETQNIGHWYSDYNEFLESIDSVYVASPHETHYEYVKQALLVRKHVICEKPICLKSAQVEELYKTAKEKAVVLLEAIKTAYFPGFQKLLEVAESGCIGEIRDVEACFTKLTDENGRELSDTSFGGSVTELASYVLLPIFKLLGTEYKDLSFQSVKAENGVDTYTKIILSYEDTMALGKVGLGVKSEGQLVIAGTKGYILCKSPWWLTKYFQVRYEDPNKIEEYKFEIEGSGLQYEIEEFVAAVKTMNEGRQSDMFFDVSVSSQESVAIAGVIEKYKGM